MVTRSLLFTSPTSVLDREKELYGVQHARDESGNLFFQNGDVMFCESMYQMHKIDSNEDCDIYQCEGGNHRYKIKKKEKKKEPKQMLVGLDGEKYYE